MTELALKSGTPYSLKEIFSGENEKVIVPDLQRDYCWGNPFTENNDDSLVKTFIEGILKLDMSNDITMGIIYGYYNNELSPYHLQLCDGQQRLTTLFLLIGMINRELGTNKYRKTLISDFELIEDDKEPHLLYSIRESSLYFMSDLTVNFFLNTNLPIEQIKEQGWYLKSYDLDPTIQSMILALQTIDSCLKDYQKLEELGDFVLNHIQFLFYDMKDRQNGEETFVVINTTGEPLSTNQNLKPHIIINNPNYHRSVIDKDGEKVDYSTAHDWEEMETWFWQKRVRNGHDTSDEGMIAFLHCVRILESKDEVEWHKFIDIEDDKFQYDCIKMEDIWDWFQAYKRVYEIDYSSHDNNITYSRNPNYGGNEIYHYTQTALYSILPTMVYCRKYSNANILDIQRIHHLFCNMSRYRSTNRSSVNENLNVPHYKACKMIREMNGPDILTLLDCPIFNVDEEINKLQFIKKFSSDEDKRKTIEDLFAKAEDFNIFNGRISTIINWSSESFDTLQHIFKRVKKLWIDGNVDTVRRALLAYDLGQDAYPMNIGSRNMTLCNNDEWRDLFEQQSKKMLDFLDEDIDSLISNYNNLESPFYLLIKETYIEDFSNNKRIRLLPQNVIQLMQKEKANAQYLLFHRGEVFKRDMLNKANWGSFSIWNDYSDSVFYSIANNLNITIDLKVDGNKYIFALWTDRAPEKKTVEPEILEQLGFKHNENYWTNEDLSSDNPQEAKQRFFWLSEKIVEMCK